MACVSVRTDVSEWFPVNVGLRQGCVMSKWFNIYMDDVVSELHATMLGKGLKPLRVNGGRFEKKQLLFADNAAPVAHAEEQLCRLVSEFGREYERRIL